MNIQKYRSKPLSWWLQTPLYAWRLWREPHGRHLWKAHGVIHVGANEGQERDFYSRYNLNVVWIEPIPEVFQILQGNIGALPSQQAFQCLITDKDDGEYTFHVSDNGGASSSIFDMALHREMFPEVDYEREVKLRSTTLDSLVREKNIDLKKHKALVLDTQGSEMLVLQGAETTLKSIDYLKIEVADFECYAGGCQAKDVDDFLQKRGFALLSKDAFMQQQGIGACYDVSYRRVR